jgi:hypothetical protein
VLSAVSHYGPPAEELEAHAVFVKPCDPEALLAAIKSLL